MMVVVVLLAGLVGAVIGDVNEKSRLASGAISSDFQGLQAPPLPTGQAGRHDPCKDSFHSFLCLSGAGRRVRIDGSLQQIANRQKSHEQKADGTAVQPEILQKPSRYYLPDSNFHPPQKTVDILEIKDTPGIVNPPNKLYLPLETSSSNESPAVPKELPKTNLPQEELNASPESTNILPNYQGGALLPAEIRKISSKHEETHTLERLCNDPFHSFLCKPLKPRKRIDGNIRPNAKLPPNALLGASSIRREARISPQQTGRALLPASSNEKPSRNYLPLPEVKPSLKPSVSYGPPPPTSTQKPTYHYSTNKPSSGYSQSSASTVGPSILEGSYSYSRPVNSFAYGVPVNSFTTRPTNKPTVRPPTVPQTYPTYQPTTTRPVTYQTTSQPSVLYQKPSNIPASVPFLPATQKPITQRPVTYPTTSRPAPPSYQYQQPTNIQPNVQPGYNYPKPSVPFPPATQKPTTQRPVTYPTTPRPAPPSYQYQQPTNIQPNVQPGYNYPKPSVPFPPAIQKPTTQRPVTYPTTPRPAPPSYQYQQPTNIQPNVQPGYNYPKPSVPFPPATQKPTTQRPVTYPTTPRPAPPSYLYQQPTNILPNVQPGYNYPKPSVPFPPATQKPTIQRPVTYPTTPRPAPPSYQYQQPTNIQPNVQPGYNYPKPSVPFPPATQKPTTQRPVTYPTTPRPAPPSYLYQQPTNILPNVQPGYNYPKPSVPFPPATQKPTTQRPVTYPTTPRPAPPSYQYQQPTNIQPNVQPGYNYPKPSVPFPPATQKPTTQRPVTYPTTPRPAPPSYLYQQPTNILPNVQPGYNYPKPSVPFPPATQKPTTQRPVTYPTTPRPAPPSYLYQQPTNILPNVQPGYNYPKPSVPFPPATQKPTTKRPVTYPTTPRPAPPSYVYPQPTNILPNVQPGYDYPKPSVPFPPATQKPTTQRPVTYPTTPRPAPPSYQYQQPTNIQLNVQQGYNYPKPSVPFPPATQKPTTQRPVTYPTTPRPPPPSYQYQQSTNIHTGYGYPKPSVPFPPATQKPTATYPTTPRPVFPSNLYQQPTFQTSRPATYQPTSQPSFQNFQYQKPSNIPVSTQNFQSGYTYQKPSVSFSETRPTTAPPTTYQTTTNRPITYQTTKLPQDYLYPKPSNVAQNFVNLQQNGYNYPKPENQFAYETPARPVTFQTSTYRPTTYQTTTFQTTTFRPVTYPTTTTRPVTYQTTSRPSLNYQYPKPSNVQQSVVRPSLQAGYNYEKPSISFNYGPPATTKGPLQTTTFTYPTTTSRPFIYQTTKIPDNPYPKPSNVQQSYVRPTGQNGYNYQKPALPFTYGTTERTTTYRPTNPPTIYTFPSTYQTTTLSPLYQQPSNVQQNVIESVYQKPNPPTAKPTNQYIPPQQQGYEYNKPAKPFDLPNQSATLVNEAFRSFQEPLGAVKFGERLKPRLQHNTNDISRNDEFPPLRNFELI